MSMNKSQPRPIAGYLRVYRRWQAVKARLDKKLDALNPLRRTVVELHDRIKVKEGRLTGGQLGAVRRILNAPSPAFRSNGSASHQEEIEYP